MLFRSNDTATTEIYTTYDTLSLHDALPILSRPWRGHRQRVGLPIPIEPGISRIGQLRRQNLHAIVTGTRLLDRDFQRRHQLNAVLDAVAEVLKPAYGLRTFLIAAHEYVAHFFAATWAASIRFVASRSTSG